MSEESFDKLFDVFKMAWDGGGAFSFESPDHGENEHDSSFRQNINGTMVEQGRTYNMWIEEDGKTYEKEKVRITALRSNVIRFAKDGYIYSGSLHGKDPLTGKQWKRRFALSPS